LAKKGCSGVPWEGSKVVCNKNREQSVFAPSRVSELLDLQWIRVDSQKVILREEKNKKREKRIKE
jgi:predicted secreted acid phosphatase